MRSNMIADTNPATAQSAIGPTSAPRAGEITL
jgi:hypothetical protein